MRLDYLLVFAGCCLLCRADGCPLLAYYLLFTMHHVLCCMCNLLLTVMDYVLAIACDRQSSILRYCLLMSSVLVITAYCTSSAFLIVCIMCWLCMYYVYVHLLADCY